MGDPHNKSRYGETWAQHRIDAYLMELEHLKPHVVFSGGWAWHFMSPLNHTELKHAHDHKDVDIMVPTSAVGVVMPLLLSRAFKKVPTRFDHLPSAEEFRRYEKHVTWWICAECPWEGMVADMDAQQWSCPCPACTAEMERRDTFRVTIDFFVRDVPERVIDGWRVVDPATLVTFYSTIHSSKSCFAVVAAKKLLAAGIDPMGHPDLVAIPEGS